MLDCDIGPIDVVDSWQLDEQKRLQNSLRSSREWDQVELGGTVFTQEFHVIPEYHKSKDCDTPVYQSEGVPVS
jgi:hypothetical protein